MGKVLLTVLFIITCCELHSQELSTTNKRARKLYEQGQRAIKDRDFPTGIACFRDALDRDPQFYEAYLRLASAYRTLREIDSAFIYLDRYWQIVPVERVHPRTAANLANQYFQRGDYANAREAMDLVNERTGPNASMVDPLLNESINFALEASGEEAIPDLKPLPETVNRFHSQYFPAITIDNRMLFFTKREGPSVVDDEDIVVSVYEEGQWTPAQSISPTINSRNNEGACTISADGRTLIFTSCEDQLTIGSCDLFISTREGNTWSEPQNMGQTINSEHWDSQPSISADGRFLYFSSNRPGGEGGRDLWVTRYADDHWLAPTNLGPAVNTAKDETTPYIHVNNETLFFASNGWPGFGGHDLYRIEWKDSTWQEARNLGFGINNHQDQLSLIVDASGTRGYFAQDIRTEFGHIRSRLVEVHFPTDSLVSHSASYVTGRVRDISTDEPIKAKIQLYELNSSRMMYSTQSDPVTGIYFFALRDGQSYGVYATADGYLFEDFEFEAQNNTAQTPDTVDILLRPIAEGAAMVLENIYFDLDSYQLRPSSHSELQVIAQFIKNNGVVVEISGHTDATGTSSHNQRLSTLRAEAVYYYLINLGVDPDSLRFAGYGATQMKYLEEDQQHLNRRIEFEVLHVK